MSTENRDIDIGEIGLDLIKAGLERIELEGKTKPDENDKLETRSVEEDRKKVEIDALRENNADKKANRSLRENYANRVFYYLCTYSFGAFSLIVLSGIGFLEIPEAVLTTIVGSTALAAIGLVGFVVSGLFKPQQ
ncbi:MAG: hypothetical protein JHC88_21225 [Niveispirillum sp.]|nr:hypothetical protein [Niveispirillum sp.]